MPGSSMRETGLYYLFVWFYAIILTYCPIIKPKHLLGSGSSDLVGIYVRGWDSCFYWFVVFVENGR